MSKKINANIPLSETAFYILMSLNEPRHGYGIIKYVETLTKGRIKLGSGTVYTTLGKMSKKGFITVYQDKDRKTIYELTKEGKLLVQLEMARVKLLYQDSLHQEGLMHEN